VLVEGRLEAFDQGGTTASARRRWAKVLANPEPLGYRQRTTRPKPRLGDFASVIDEILKLDKNAPPHQRRLLSYATFLTQLKCLRGSSVPHGSWTS
jgi:hypothetical protein